MGETGEQREMWEGASSPSAAPAGADLLAELNEEQRAAVTHTDGPLLILAGPGSGKTRVITTRIAHLVLDHGVPAESILAITFTNKAAREMRERTERMIGVGGAWISTFHSMCARILRREIEGLGGGWTRDYSIYDTADRNQLLRKLIKETGYDTTRFKPATLGAWISEAKSARATGEPGGELDGGSMEDEVLRKVYERYVAALEENNALDFDDLQLKTLELFERHPAVRDAYARRFRYVMVDEYQDTNRVQYLLARHLSSAHKNLAVCGDPDQSIYSWRGADIRNILDFEQDYPDPAVVKLERNYRSSGNILRSAQSVISNNTARKPKELITDREDGEPVRVFLCGDENDEATEIGHRIQSHLARGRRASEVAVFYRLNFMQRALETTFTRQRISYQVLGGVEFFQRKEIRDLIAYLKLLMNPNDQVAFARIANVPARGVGAKSLEKILGWASDRRVGILEAAQSGEALEAIRGRAKKGLAEVGALYEDLAPYREGPAAEALTSLLAQLDVDRWLSEANDGREEEREANVREFEVFAEQFDADDPEGGLRGFLEHVSLVSDVDGMDDEAEKVTLMTLHAAKGLEFPIVFIAGVEEEILPHARAVMESEGDEGMEEERRLFYVGITRAEEELHLFHAETRT
ncbi:MAG: UvrD-helicase domain-containing protein, partial [Planctomycetes bacterium]|nr:UvrD-helicase domain-containing protein [Planctomycetota bacterium]